MHGDDGRKLAHLVGPLPGEESGGSVGPEDHEELTLGLLGSKGTQGVSGVRHAARVDLDATGLESVRVGHRCLHHREAVLGGTDGPAPDLLPRHVVDHEEHAVEREIVADVDCRDQMTDVWGVEGAPEDPEPLAAHPRNLFGRRGAARAVSISDFRHQRPENRGWEAQFRVFAL